MAQPDLDVLIVGAGVSGIGIATHLRRDCPHLGMAILERRQVIGGTWDLFRYPGIRSDSDMSTFGYEFKPWMGSKTLADGESIRQYVTEAAQENAVDGLIQFGQRMLSANWSDADQYWTAEVADQQTGQRRKMTARYLIGCTGYYNHDQGYKPQFDGEADFQGTMVHPQFWPSDLDYRGKRVVIIGSGATAVTLLPAMATDAAHVTMLQRSPTYIATVPSSDPIFEAMIKVMPVKLAYRITRMRNIALQRGIYVLARRAPAVMRRSLLGAVKAQLRGAAPMEDFTPSYQPWDQRLCAVPDGDLFKAVRSGKASVVTDHIERLTADGILLKSGRTLEADIIVTATGLELQMLGGATVSVNGQPFDAGEHVTYKGIMIEGLPNAAVVFGYTNASWTLRVDLIGQYLGRLFSHMRKQGYQGFVARDPGDQREAYNILGDLKSGYIARAKNALPRQGKTAPWHISHDYTADRKALLNEPIADPENLHFTQATKSGSKSARKKPGLLRRAFQLA